MRFGGRVSFVCVRGLMGRLILLAYGWTWRSGQHVLVLPA